MRFLLAPAILAMAMAGCLTHRPAAAMTDPVQGEAEVYLYLQPLKSSARPLAFTFAAVAAVASDGSAVPLTLASAEISGTEAPSQRLDRLGPAGARDLHGNPGDASGAPRWHRTAPRRHCWCRASPRCWPARSPLPLEAPRCCTPPLEDGLGGPRRARLRADVSPCRWPGPPSRSSWATPATPRPTAWPCSIAGPARSWPCSPPDGRPRGWPSTPRGPGSTWPSPARTRCRSWTSPPAASCAASTCALAMSPGSWRLSPDGRTLVVVNRGSASASFFEPSSDMEVARVQVGDEPGPLLLDRTGQRAFVVNQGSATITLLDLGQRARGGHHPDRSPAHPRGAEPGRQPGSTWSTPHRPTCWCSPSRTSGSSIGCWSGWGLGGLKVDPRTDLVYVSSRDSGSAPNLRSRSRCCR